MPTTGRRSRQLWAVLATLVAATALSACKEVEKPEQDHYQPATLSPLAGDDEHFIVRLTPEGARRIAIRTERVRGTATARVIPYAALLYEKDGATFVYVSSEPRTYRRAQVVVDRIVGARVLMRSGPAVGTFVVTTGAAQVHGAELGYGEY